MLTRLFKLFRRRKRKRREPMPSIYQEIPAVEAEPVPTLHTSAAGIAFLKQWEGVRHEAYRDAIDLLTIGVGHLLTRDELFSGKLFLPGREVRWRNTLNEGEIEALLRMDLFGPEDTLREKVPTLNQPQFDALVSFTFNVGQQAFRDSTLLKKLQAGDIEGAAAEFPRWKYAGGKVLRGLERRREAEREMFLA